MSRLADDDADVTVNVIALARKFRSKSCVSLDNSNVHIYAGNYQWTPTHGFSIRTCLKVCRKVIFLESNDFWPSWEAKK